VTPFADVTLDSGGLLTVLLVGLIAGLLAGRWMKGGGYGVVGDIVVGLVGALIGGTLFGVFVSGTPNYLGSLVVAFLGACLLIAVLRVVSPGRVHHDRSYGPPAVKGGRDR
jgi:uncharacterized membrane protein YeaQ/YmgE (transglycosylase-associated protein family)